MFDNIAEESMMDQSNASMDLGNLSTIFGSSKPALATAKIEWIEERPEEEEDGRKASLFMWDWAETESKFSETTEVLNDQQKQRFNSIFNESFKEEDSLVFSPPKKQSVK